MLEIKLGEFAALLFAAGCLTAAGLTSLLSRLISHFDQTIFRAVSGPLGCASRTLALLFLAAAVALLLLAIVL